MLDRRQVIQKAYTECMREMYAKAQPSADYDAIVAGVKDGSISDSDKDPVYARHYLSQEEFKYILNKYIKAYGMNSTWHPYVDTVRRYFDGKGMKDAWVDDKVDEYGVKHSGYRVAEGVPHIAEAFKEILAKQLDGEHFIDTLVDSLSKVVFEYIDNCENFYRVDREEGDFSCSVALGASPTSSPKTAVEYWQKQGVDVNIEWRNPLLLWEMDEYGDNFEEFMVELYGLDWEEYWKNEWEKRKDLENYGYDE